jgi:hypothetical protein
MKMTGPNLSPFEAAAEAWARAFDSLPEKADRRALIILLLTIGAASEGAAAYAEIWLKASTKLSCAGCAGWRL